MLSTTWQEYGYNIGIITEEMKAAGGVWLIGDNLPFFPWPEYPGYNNGLFMLKRWYAKENDGKYGPDQYKLKTNPAGLWEYVYVADGVHTCTVYRQAIAKTFAKTATVSLTAADAGIDLPPQIIRSWRLTSPSADGITICHQPQKELFIPGEGLGYTWRNWNTRYTDLETMNLLMTERHRMKTWSSLLTLIFAGTLTLKLFQNGELLKHIINEDNFIFINKGVEFEVDVIGEARGLTIFF